MNLTAPIYFSAGMTERANEYYKLYIGWTNENVKATFVERYDSYTRGGGGGRWLQFNANGRNVSLMSAWFYFSNMFDFKHIRSFDRTMADQPGPMVLFATPGMLHAGWIFFFRFSFFFFFFSYYVN